MIPTERERDARLDDLISRAECASELCADCEVGEPHMCPDRSSGDVGAEVAAVLADEADR